MKKLLLLLVVAAVVGFAISKSRHRGATSTPSRGVQAAAAAEGTEQAPAPAAEADAAGRATQGAPAPSADASMAAPVARALVAHVPAREAAREAVPHRPVLLEAEAPAAPLAQPSQAAQPVQPSGGVVQAGQPGDKAGDKDGPEDVRALLEAGKRVEARAILSRLYLEAHGEQAHKLRDLLDRINKDLVFNARCVEGAQIHVVQQGETLEAIGKKYGQNWRMIARVNGMSDDRLRAGQRIKIVPGQTSAIIYKGEFRMALLIDGVYAKEYVVGIGTEDKTPAGEFVVDNMLVHPTWYPPGGGKIEYGQPGHLLGERWIGFRDEPGAAGIGIHGTNDEATVGTKCSNGCIRMHKADILEVYDFMRSGSRVEIKD